MSVVLRKLTGPVSCCGAVPSRVWTSHLGTRVEITHGPKCRIGRLLRWPGASHAPGAEILPVNDRHQLRRAIR